ncbi:MAG: hypothetical protein BAJALOKI3v1_450023 [Promethearchaeota archaeon]|nr:MAG: hypothetical protein BAJALOKI3v1_450023 [Candidatus Lokiarchaeota archaeon]
MNMMIEAEKKDGIESYKFHHIDTRKCAYCKDFLCEKACFRNIYTVVDKEGSPRCTIVPDREDFCVKCHICTTQCKFKALTID